jgi:hypothetical protein
LVEDFSSKPLAIFILKLSLDHFRDVVRRPISKDVILNHVAPLVLLDFAIDCLTWALSGLN